MQLRFWLSELFVATAVVAIGFAILRQGETAVSIVWWSSFAGALFARLSRQSILIGTATGSALGLFFAFVYVAIIIETNSPSKW